MGIRAKDIFILGILIVCAPAVSLLFRENLPSDIPSYVLSSTSPSTATPDDATQDTDIQNSEATQENPLHYVLYDEATGTPFSVSERDYVIAAVLSELPCTYEYEAIKAQAVATRTYARYVAALRKEQPLPELQGGIFSVNTATHWGYMTEEQGSLFYGNRWERHRSLVTQAVDETEGLLITYNNAPIAACYHAISSGMTENSEAVFGYALPYLTSVDSNWDTEADGYRTEEIFTADELASLLRQYDSDFVTSGSPSEWIGSTAATSAGTVTQFIVCGHRYTGAELREALSLRSAVFTATYRDGVFCFDVRGYGHGVGLSQNGANSMAKQGASFVEILTHYYPGTICRIAESS